MKTRLLTGLLILAATASAAIMVTTTPGPTTTQVGAETITFDAPVPAAGSPYEYTAPSGIKATYSWLSSISPFVTGSLSGQYAEPPNDPNTLTYLTAGSGEGRPASVKVDFSVAIKYFGVYMGSPDTYNQIDFVTGNTTTSFAGSQLFTPADGNQAVGMFVNFNSDAGISQIVFSSSQAAFETDNHAFGNAVPEPATYALMGAGLAALAVFGSRRRRSRD